MKSHLQVAGQVAAVSATDSPEPTTLEFTATPAGAGSLRIAEFIRLMRLQRTWGTIGGAAAALFVFALLRGQAAPWLLPAIALVVGLGTVLWIADRNAANAFWEVYARTRGYELGGRTRLPEATPLLREGYTSYATRTLEGQIAPGLFGMLALFTYEEETVGLNGQVETDYHDFTIATVELPECARYMPELYAQARRGPRQLSKFGDAFRRDRRRVTLESEALGKSFEILVGEGQDEIWTRRLFSPAFVVWLAESPPRKLSFELVDGSLVAYLPGHREKAKDLDGLAAAAGTIARRLLEESAQIGTLSR
jgi:hypothetical protein